VGLIDVLNGMQNGPRGARGAPSGSSGGGMSPITMAILGLLAYKALKSFTGQSASPANAGVPPGAPAPMPEASSGGGLGDLLKNVLGGGAGASPGAGSGGGLGDLLKNVLGGGAAPTQVGGASTQAGAGGAGNLNDLLKGGLGGLLAGGAAGSVLSGGLNDLLKQLQQAGHGEAANSWVGPGPNKTIAPNDLANALGADQIDAMMSHSGLSRDELLSGLSQYLPQAVDSLTPSGRVPTEHEIVRSL
jgi:uncharacterized protein YidB (DUF937 family)